LPFRQTFSKGGAKEKQNACFPTYKSKATHLLNGSLSQAPCIARAAVSSSYWICEVHHGASCPLLQQEFPLWASLQLAPFCQPELRVSRSHCLKESDSSSAPCCSSGNGCYQGPASILNSTTPSW